MMLDVNRLRALARGEIPAAPAKTPFSLVAPVAPPAPVAATGAATGLSPCSYSVTGATGQNCSYHENERNESVAAPVADPVAACSASAEASEYEIDEAEREAIAIELGGVPTVYASGFARLQAQPPPEVPCNRWDQFINDAGLFFDRWGKQAEALGWRADELFGLDPTAPMGRYDRMGLIWMLRGQTVIHISGTAARLSGGLTFYRKAAA
jgi:hypothetical protein